MMTQHWVLQEAAASTARSFRSVYKQCPAGDILELVLVSVSCLVPVLSGVFVAMLQLHFGPQTQPV